ncbi:MAG: acetate/propionate family kinase [Planctomycetota bacterium]
MKVLVLNVGSTTLKVSVMDSDTGESIHDELIDRIGQSGGDATDHASAMQDVWQRCQVFSVDAIGHRVVQGASVFPAATLVSDETLAELKQLDALAPLHNPPARGVIEWIHQRARLPQVMVFDTSFFASLPRFATQYAIPNHFYVEHGLRRYGAHGTSHQYVTGVARNWLMQRDLPSRRVISLHLGGGASITASLEGAAVDTSMGLTPLEGLVMATRSGDVDPSIVLALMTQHGLSADDVSTMLNRESGLKGLCGDSDMRTILERRRHGDADASRAIEIYVHRIRKAIGAYVAVLGGLDALIFTAGVGEKSAEIRALVLDRLDCFGLSIDQDTNQSPAVDEVFDISEYDAAAKTLIVATNESLAIAQQTHVCLMPRVP